MVTAIAAAGVAPEAARAAWSPLAALYDGGLPLDRVVVAEPDSFAAAAQPVAGATLRGEKAEPAGEVTPQGD